MALNFLGIELKDWVTIVALLVSATVPSVLFLVGRSRATRSEQFRFSLQIWDRIAAQADTIHGGSRLDDLGRVREGINLEKALESLKSELSFFVHLVEIGEIKDRNVREYYRYPPVGISNDVTDPKLIIIDTPHINDILRLIEKYHSLTGGVKKRQAS
jgi:hypothetical protein